MMPLREYIGNKTEEVISWRVCYFDQNTADVCVITCRIGDCVGALVNVRRWLCAVRLWVVCRVANLERSSALR